MTTDFHAGDLEFRSSAEIRVVQEALLRRHLEYAAARSPYYGALFRERGIETGAVTLATLATLPLTDKSALGERNADFLAVPMSRVVDVALSSGTTGGATTVMYTEGDLLRLAYNEEISFAGCGLTCDDVVLLTCTIDRCFVAGLAYFSGLRKLGAAAIRNGLSSVESHREIIRRLKPTAIVGVPSFLLKLARHLNDSGFDAAGAGVSRLICIGEPVRDRELGFLKVGAELERLWNARVYSTYASSETITSFCECAAQRGGHLHPDLAVVEIIDEAGRPLAAGEIGEVVVTPLAIEGMPLVRFRTGDVSFLVAEPCVCGRNSPRLGPILGRKQQMLKFRGTTLYPGSINVALDTMSGIGEYYVEASSANDLTDLVRVFVSVTDESCTAELIMDRLQAHLRVRPEVLVVPDDHVRGRVYARVGRKPIRFVDERRLS